MAHTTMSNIWSSGLNLAKIDQYMSKGHFFLKRHPDKESFPNLTSMFSPEISYSFLWFQRELKLINSLKFEDDP